MKKFIIKLTAFLFCLISLGNAYAEDMASSASVSIIGAIDATNSCNTTITPTNNTSSSIYTLANIQCTYPTSVQVIYQSNAGIVIQNNNRNNDVAALTPQTVNVRPARSKNIAFVVSETPEIRHQESTYAMSSTGGRISILNHKNEYVAHKKYNIPLSITGKNTNNDNQHHSVTVELYFL